MLHTCPRQAGVVCDRSGIAEITRVVATGIKVLRMVPVTSSGWEAVLQAEEGSSPLARPWRCVPVVCSPEWLLSETPVRFASGGPDGFRISFHRRRRIRALVPMFIALAAFLSLLIVNDSLGAPLHTTYISLAMCLFAAGALVSVAVILAPSAVLEVTPAVYSLWEKDWLSIYQKTPTRMAGRLDELQGCRVRL
jgi:hypothetical protein